MKDSEIGDPRTLTNANLACAPRRERTGTFRRQKGETGGVQVRRLGVLMTLAAVLAWGCGGAEEITAGEIGAMSEQEALALLDCQMQLAAEDLGEQEALDLSVDMMEEGMESGDTTPIQVELWNEHGYRCPELAP